MEKFVLLILGLLVLWTVAICVTLLMNRRAKRETKENFNRVGQQLMEKLNSIVESQRLSTILRLEPSSLKVDPKDFEANKPILLTKLLQALEEEKHLQPSTRAYCILEHSGWNLFVEGNTALNAKYALGRLITNNDKETARKFLEELVNKL